MTPKPSGLPIRATQPHPVYFEHRGETYLVYRGLIQPKFVSFRSNFQSDVRTNIGGRVHRTELRNGQRWLMQPLSSLPADAQKVGSDGAQSG